MIMTKLSGYIYMASIEDNENNDERWFIGPSVKLNAATLIVILALCK
jgi:hypothetical protein